VELWLEAGAEIQGGCVEPKQLINAQLPIRDNQKGATKISGFFSKKSYPYYLTEIPLDPPMLANAFR